MIKALVIWGAAIVPIAMLALFALNRSRRCHPVGFQGDLSASSFHDENAAITASCPVHSGDESAPEASR